MKYQNKKNGIIAELIQESEKFKTVFLHLEDGSEKTISTSTLKRWWKALPEEKTEDDYVQEVMDQKKELGIDVPEIQPEQVEVVSNEDRCSDGTSYKEVMTEIVAGAKKKAKDVKKASKTKKTSVKRVDRTDSWNKFTAFIQEAGLEVRLRAPRFRANIRNSERLLFEIRLTQSGATFYMKQAMADECGFTYSLITNYSIPAVVKVTDDKEAMETIEKLVKLEGGK